MSLEAGKRVALVGAPLALGQSLPGVGLAPQALRQAGLAEAIKELGYEVIDTGDLVLPSAEIEEVRPHPFAALHHEEGSSVALVSRVKHSYEVGQACRLIAQEVEQFAGLGDQQHHDCFILTLGGDHSIALGSITGVLRARPDTALIWVDAHGDFNTPETSPSGNLHGMPLATLLNYTQLELPGFDWLHEIPNVHPLLTPERVALVGVRSLDKAERDLLRQAGVHVYSMATIDRYGIGSVMERAMVAVNPEGKLNYHVSFDIDAMDPREAPGTGTRARGGLTYREGHTILEMLAGTGKLGSMDLVEINPELDQDNITVSLGIELVTSALGKEIF
jgi:arginase